ncbi:hypothetical protein HFO56_39475 [Rhizobium laguerreae]|uniref:hypothetical protein n=1 Tax=Rhizobium laguerreae TaxID=1076926 RepID=UPI001C91BCFF|nr:hypothetical protein [Rhizobium laguerreae]MBY3158382.1 hypothetical protein [Rhizobium laguerreae]
MIEGWKYPTWEQVGEHSWFLMHDGALVGEAHALTGDTFKWQCLLSGTLDTAATSIEHAKAESLASFWREQWRNLAEANPASYAAVKMPFDEIAPPTTDLEQMCRDHFNEPVLLGTEVGRLVGYAEDERDSYLIIHYPNPSEPKIVWHTCVGGYHWLDRLRGQHLVIAYNGERWDDFYRVDSDLERCGAPKVGSFILERRRPL